MPDDTLEPIQIVSAKVTGLVMLVEALWVDRLAEFDDPALAAQVMLDHQFKSDDAVRKNLGDSAYALQISEFVSSLIDRASARAVARKAK